VKREDGCLTGEKMTDGRDGLLRGEGRAGLATADLLYAAAAARRDVVGMVDTGRGRRRGPFVLLRTCLAAATYAASRRLVPRGLRETASSGAPSRGNPSDREEVKGEDRWLTGRG
jgi:hypothetical protein